ncbi:MAG: 4Fe-4S dicluster domain-containing protein [Ignavibacteriales bacterium]|nr:4Fe-4S dicluster domain-containing protein [Ignavibacteriales bacterium]
MIRGSVVVATDVCKGCELCIAACPQDTLALSPQINRRGYRYAVMVQDNCTGCINCALVCPDSAITVYRQPKVTKHALSPQAAAEKEN